MSVLHDRVKDGVAATIVTLALTDIGNNVFAQWVQIANNVDFPCVLCSVDGETETLLGGTTREKRIRYPVRVLLCNDDVIAPEDAPKYAGWRDQMVQAFHQRPRPVVNGVRGDLIYGVPEAQDTQALPMPILEIRNQQGYENVVSGLRVNVECVFPR